MREKILKGKILKIKEHTMGYPVPWPYGVKTSPLTLFLPITTREYEIETSEGKMKVGTRNPYQLRIGDEVEIHTITKKILRIFSRKKHYIQYGKYKIPVSYLEKIKEEH
jgi:hypothetical protein